MTTFLISTIGVVLGAGITSILRSVPGALDQIVRTTIIWQRRHDLQSLGDATFVSPDETDTTRDVHPESAQRAKTDHSPRVDFHTGEMHRTSDTGGRP